ncbi:hypothetical protein E2562_015728 [Oryza meyeriana var. granulata]|uniref:Uncharacterized protein n=1 Tax=Oryza meyeriana var. granulata TaxID=110450 RepID=A0A6G1D466_9ORYZ|nr:hypothetical protein E2562_015728 [Oryza meyeriana var. granulata]
MDEGVGRHARLLVKNDASCYGEESECLLEAQELQLKTKKSNWRAPSIILGLECLESMAFNGIATNLVVYIRSVLHGSIASSASTSSLWYGTSFFVPILGATIADTYWGNYKTVLISFIMYLLGTVLITVGAFIPSAPALCSTESCSLLSGTQSLVFFSGLYLTAIGCGGVRSALLPLGADQFNSDSSLDMQKRRNFFSFFYICVIFGVITSGTVVVWVQENVSWAIGYGIATACIALALIGFLVGTPIFRRHEPHGSAVKSVFQVIVASFRNMTLELPADSSLLYEIRVKNTRKSEPRLAHTDDFRFLDKAAIMSDLNLDQGSCTSPWRNCTVTQVEELKILIRLLPIWATGIFFGAAISQMHTTFIQQGTVMDTKIGSLSIPPASLYSFEVVCVTLWVFIVNKVIIPATRTCFANGAEMTQLQRIGIGRLLMIFAMAIAAFLETKRLESIQEGRPLSIAWQLPQYFVIAGAECFTIITQLEFFHGQAPDSMKSMLTAFALLTTALGNYLSSAIITLIARVTRTWHSPGWIPDDLNEGHLDYYYWCLAAISFVNFIVYIYFASKYKLKKAVIQTLSLSPPATSRAAADLFRFLVRRRSLHPSDSALALVVRHLARRRDFPAVRSLVQEFPSALGPATLDAYLLHLASAGRPTDAVKVFDELPEQLRTREALTSLVSSLSAEGWPSHAERAVKKVANEIFPDDNICTLLVSGYANAGKLDHALRLIGETRRGGFQPGLDTYNAVLDCVCRLCRKKDPLRMPAEAEKFLVDMEANGIPRDAGTFRVLITNLCKIRKTEDAMNLFRRMGEWGCSPDADTYLVLIKSLYQAARISEGDEMITWMWSAGFGDKLDRKAYYGFIKILCGIERVEHAVKVFRMMKGYGHAPGTKSYSLLIEKLARHNLGDRANALFREAVARGVTVTPGVYKIDKNWSG